MTLSTPNIDQEMPLAYRIQKNWLVAFLLLFGLFNVLPFSAPLMMRAGWETGANAIYTLYAPLCHQMAQRSFFLFGEQMMYNAADLPVALVGDTHEDALLMRRYRGDAGFGWKVAWSDRMVYMYSGMWLAGLSYAFRRRSRQIAPFSLKLFAVLLLPMGIDGVTHFLSDFNGLTAGFRYTNDWLVSLTGGTFPASFYAGDGLGSFNSWMRLLSGMTLGIAAVGLAFPYIDRSMQLSSQRIEEKYAQLNELEHALRMEIARRQQARRG